MIDDSWESLAKWEETQDKHEDGRIAICFGLAATLYFHDGHKEEKRQASLECFNEYEQMCGTALRWHCVGAESMRFSPVSKLHNRDMTPYLLSAKWQQKKSRESAWSFYWHGGKHQDDADALRIQVYGSPAMYAEVDNSLSFLHVSFPVRWFGDRPNEFCDLVRRWCERLKPYHGYGGITLLTSPDRGLSQRYSQNIAGYAGRYPGLEIDRPMSHKLVTQDYIKGGNWLTVLSKVFVERLEENGDLTSQLGESFTVEKYNGGVIIIAGQSPETGDLNRNIETNLYRALASVLKPIRIKDHPRPFAKGPFGEEGKFSEWIARFDE